MSFVCNAHGWRSLQQACPNCVAVSAGQAAAAAAFPPPIVPQPDSWTTITGGLTKRELFALENHAQLIRFVQRGALTSGEAAVIAIHHADALLAELSK